MLSYVQDVSRSSFDPSSRRPTRSNQTFPLRAFSSSTILLFAYNETACITKIKWLHIKCDDCRRMGRGRVFRASSFAARANAKEPNAGIYGATMLGRCSSPSRTTGQSAEDEHPRADCSDDIASREFVISSRIQDLSYPSHDPPSASLYTGHLISLSWFGISRAITKSRETDKSRMVCSLPLNWCILVR